MKSADINEIDFEIQNQSNNQLQNRNISPRNNFLQREILNVELQRERIRNLRIDSTTNVFICIGVLSLCGFIGYFIFTGNYLYIK